MAAVFWRVFWSGDGIKNPDPVDLAARVRRIEGGATTRFMIVVKATNNTEAGKMPEEKLIGEMATYHEEPVKAGALLDASGLQPTSKGWRIQYSRGRRTVIDGPFTEARVHRRLHPHPGEVQAGEV